MTEKISLDQQITCVERLIYGLQPVQVPLRARVVTVDAEDLYTLALHSWRPVNGKSGHYIVCQLPRTRKQLLLHRELLAAPAHLMVDHIHGDTLDCRKHNLRLATHQQNCMNSKGQNKTSKYKGVSYQADRKTWVASVKAGNMVKHTVHATEIEAARAYDARASEYHGEFARLNFPDCTDRAAHHLECMEAVSVTLNWLRRNETAVREAIEAKKAAA